MRDIGIDLGTKNVLIYIKGKGIVLNEASAVAFDKETKKVLAVGNEADNMIGRTPEKIEAITPMKDGVIADFDATEAMLNLLIKKATGKKFLQKTRMVICCPTDITAVEKNAIREIAERTGAKKVIVEEEVKVAAIGAGIDITKPSGSMIIDIGGGTTDIAVISLGGIVTSSSIKIAGNKFDCDIVNYIKDKYKLIIGEKTAEELKKEIGFAIKGKSKEEKEITGRDNESGLPKTIKITGNEIEEAIREDIKTIINEVKKVLEKTPPELARDIREKGITLTGGGSLIGGLEQVLKENLNVHVFLSENPLTDVVDGTSIILDNIKLIES